MKFSPEGLERLRAATLANRPWTRARGPTSAVGRARSAANGQYRQRGEKSRREIQAELAEVLSLIHRMTSTRRLISK